MPHNMNYYDSTKKYSVVLPIIIVLAKPAVDFRIMGN